MAKEKKSSSAVKQKDALVMTKIKVIDTNVFLSDPKALFSYPGELIVIPISVIEEIDEFKKGLSELGRNAREVLRKIDKLRKRGKISASDKLGIELNNKGRLVIELNHTKEMPAGLSADKVDNRILAVAVAYKKENEKSEVTLVSKDANLRIKADALGVNALDYESLSQSTPDSFYKGYQEIFFDDEEINKFKTSGKLPFISAKLNPNEYILLSSRENPNLNAVGRFQKDEIVALQKIGEVFGLSALNPEQKMALDLLLNPNIPLVTITGKAGTGKTLLAVAAGLHQTVDGEHYTKMLISRPVFPMGKDIGYLPGTVEEKLNPWMQPIFDNLQFLFSKTGDSSKGKQAQARVSGKNMQEQYMTQGILQVEPLTYIRGRSIPQQYMIIDEAQNLTLHEIKTIITRAGKGTKIILTGDPEQIDNPYIDSQSNGLTQIVERLKDDKLTGHIHLSKGERSELAEMASNKLA